MKCDAKKCLRKAFLVLDWMWTRRHDSYRDGRDNIMQKEMLHWLVQQRMTMDGDPQRPFSPPWAFSMSRKAAHGSCPVHLWNSICIEDKKKRVNSGALVNMSVPFISLRYHLLPAVLVPTKSQEYILAKYVSGKTTDVLKLYDSPGSVFHFMLWQRCDYGLVRVRHKYHLELWKCDVLA